MGRPKGSGAIKIDPDLITQYAKTGATQGEIAQRLGVSINTIERRLAEPKYREALMRGRGELVLSLRAKQVQVALTGNVIMLKWLGEQYLDQASNHRVVDKEGKDRAIVDASPIELINARIAGVLQRRRESGGSEGT